MNCIERLDDIINSCALVLILTVVGMLFLHLVPTCEGWSREERIEKGVYKLRKISLVIIILSSLLAFFTPSTKEMYRIIGIGGTIDYLRENETAKQLPDKCIKAIDLLFDKAMEDKDKQQSPQIGTEAESK